jgi:MFS family permease
VVAYAALGECIPYFPVYAVLFSETGLSTGQISLLFIVWSVTTFALEVPSGAWADVVPRKSLLVLAAVLYGCCFALWTLAPSFPAFAAGFVLWGASSAIMSGTYEAYVFEHLAALDELARYPTVIARGESAGLLLNLAATVSAAPLIQIGGYPLVGWASVAICAVLTGLALKLEPDAKRSASAEDASGYLRTLRTGIGQALRVPSLRHAVLVAALLPAFLAFDEYFPLLAGDLGSTRSQVPLLIAVTVAAQAVGALVALRVSRRVVAPSVGAAGVAIGVGALSGTPFGFAAIAVGYGLLQMAIVAADTRLQHAIGTSARATVTSVAGVLAEVSALTVFAAFALGSDLAGLPVLVAALALVLTASASLVRRWLP